MLKIDQVQTLQGLQVYGDDRDELTYYVLPEQPRFRWNQGKLVFKYLKFRSPRKRPDGSFGGGFIIFDAEFAVDEDVRTKIIADLTAQAGRARPGAKVKLGTIQWAKGTAKLNFVSDGGMLIESVTNPMSPSLFGNNITPFTMELSQEGATFFEQALQGSGGVIQVSYEMNAWVKLPPISGTASFHSNKYYEFVQHITDDNPTCGDDLRTEEIQEKIRSSEVMKVEITSSIVTNTTVVDNIRASLMNTLEQTVAKKMLEQLGQYDGDRGMIEDYEDIRRSYKKIKIDDFSYTITESSASLWPFNPQGTLPNITSLTDGGGKPIVWGDYAQTIDLDDPFFRTLDVTVRLNADLENLPIHSVDVHLEFDGNHPVVQDLHFGKADDTGTFSCFLDGKPPEYRYSYRVNFKDTAQPYEVAARTSKLEELTIGVDDTGLLLVDVTAGNIDFAKIPTALVTVRYTPSSLPPIEEQYVLDSGHPTHRLEKAIFEPRTGPVTYQIDYRTADGKTLSTPWRETARQIYVNSPFNDLRQVMVVAEGDLSTEIESIMVDLTYTDAPNDYSTHFSGALDKDNTFLDWSFPVLDHAAGTVTYSGSIRRQDGTVETIEPTTATTGTITIGEHVERKLAVTVVPDLIDFSQVALVRVALRYGTDPDTRQDKDLLFRDGTSVTWTVELPDKSSPRDYSMSAVYYLKDGSQRPLAEASTDDLELVLPPLPPV
jgi:hypothetical protein